MLAGIEWDAPWFAPWRAAGQAVARQLAAGMPLHDALDGLRAPVRFVAASQLPAGEPYERFIFARRACPTRENRHDIFNALVWAGMPRTKLRLNALQAQQIGAEAVGPVRGPVRDAITILDENGALLQAPPPLWDALLARDWRRLFVDLRPLWAQARLTIFGHALLEQLARPRKNLTAHVFARPAAEGGLQALDGWLADQFTPAVLQGKPFTPLPIMGVPGWSAGNHDVSFYDDPQVFRAAGAGAARTRSPAAVPRS